MHYKCCPSDLLLGLTQGLTLPCRTTQYVSQFVTSRPVAATIKRNLIIMFNFWPNQINSRLRVRSISFFVNSQLLYFGRHGFRKYVIGNGQWGIRMKKCVIVLVIKRKVNNYCLRELKFHLRWSLIFGILLLSTDSV